MKKPAPKHLATLASLFDQHLLKMLRDAKGEDGQPLKAAELQVIRARLADCSITSPAVKGSAIHEIAEDIEEMDHNVQILKSSPLRISGDGKLPATSTEPDEASDGRFFKKAE